jgi:hypothetical protein
MSRAPHLSAEERAGRAALRRSWEHLPAADDEPVDAKAMAETIVADSLALLTAEARARPATMEDLWTFGIGQTLEVSFAEAVTTRDRIREVRTDFEKKLAAVERDNATLRDEVADLARQVKLARAVRGVSDGHSLPASAIMPGRREARPPAKRKPAAREVRPT